MQSFITIRVILITAFISFSGCMEYYGQLCTDEKLRDIPRMKGLKTATLYDPASAETVSSVFEITRVGKGHYKVDEAEFRTCRIAKKWLAEIKLDSGNFAAREILIGREGQYTESTLVIGRTELKALGIPYEIATRSSFIDQIPAVVRNIPFVQKRLKLLDEAPEVTLVVLNKDPKMNKRLVENLRPIYVGYSYQ